MPAVSLQMSWEETLQRPGRMAAGGEGRATLHATNYLLGSQSKLPIVGANPLVISTAEDGVSHGREHSPRRESHLRQGRQERARQWPGADGRRGPTDHWTPSARKGLWHSSWPRWRGTSRDTEPRAEGEQRYGVGGGLWLGLLLFLNSPIDSSGSEQRKSHLKGCCCFTRSGHRAAPPFPPKFAWRAC